MHIRYSYSPCFADHWAVGISLEVKRNAFDFDNDSPSDFVPWDVVSGRIFTRLLPSRSLFPSTSCGPLKDVLPMSRVGTLLTSDDVQNILNALAAVTFTPTPFPVLVMDGAGAKLGVETVGAELHAQWNSHPDEWKGIENFHDTMLSLFERYDQTPQKPHIDEILKSIPVLEPALQDYDALRKKASLTDPELVFLINGQSTVYLDSLASITDHQAEMLSWLECVILPKLQTLTDRQAESLGQVRSITLGVTKITDSQFSSLSDCDHLSLDELKETSAVQSRCLRNAKTVSLRSLNSVSLELATTLSEATSVNLSGVTEISPEALAAFGPNSNLHLGGLRTLTDEHAEALGNHDGQTLNLDGLSELADSQAEWLGNSIDLSLDGLSNITDDQAEALGKCYHLSLNGLSSITDRQAEALGNCHMLSLNGLSTITDRQAQSLAKCDHLDLNALTEISERSASHLCNVQYLYLDGLQTLSDHQARLLSTCYSVSVGNRVWHILHKYQK